MEKITKETAIKEVDSWLDYKKVNEKKRETYRDHIETLVDAVCDGSVIIREDSVIVHELKFPIEGELPINKLEYKPRVKVQTVHLHMQGVKQNDADGRVCAYVAAISSKPKEVIKALDTEDYSISQAVAIFFM